MKDYLRELVNDATDPIRGRHIVREYLQARILSGLQRAGAMIPLAFHGGTALRFLYNIPRYSEDLDFALEGAVEGYNLPAYLRAIHTDLLAENYPVDVRYNDKRTVQSGMFRFRGLLHEMGITSQPDEVLSIKVEIDTKPPEGATLALTVVRRHVFLRLQHHDRASLLSGKLHAIFQRPYAKGRDLYDLLWYLSAADWPIPNLTMLNNALTQTGWQGEEVTAENWRELTLTRLKSLDWTVAVNDVRPFLMNAGDADLISLQTFESFLGR